MAKMNKRLKGRIDRREYVASYGIYVIINHTLKKMYIGSCSKRTFLTEWSMHYIDKKLPEDFLNHVDTKFNVLRSGCSRDLIDSLHLAHINIAIKRYKDYHLYK